MGIISKLFRTKVIGQPVKDKVSNPGYGIQKTIAERKFHNSEVFDAARVVPESEAVLPTRLSQKDLITQAYDDFRANYKRKTGIDIETDFQNPYDLYEIEDLDKIAKIKHKYIDRTGFNKDAFPADTELVFFDDVFHECYPKFDDYSRNANFINSRIEKLFLQKKYERCCMALSNGNFLYYYPNRIENDATEYNISLVDKNNKILKMLVYEDLDNNNTVSNLNDIIAILKSDIEFLDLLDISNDNFTPNYDHDAYSNESIPFADRTNIKNNILMELYESRKYDNESLKLIRDMLLKGVDINYIINPCFTYWQRNKILERIAATPEDYDYLKCLREFNINTGTHFKQPFTSYEFAYIMQCLDKGDYDDFKSPEKLAWLKLNFYKNRASDDPDFYEFNIEGRYFRITKNSNYPTFDDFKIEECFKDSNTSETVSTKLVYEHQGTYEAGDLNIIVDLLKEKYRYRDNNEIFLHAIQDVYKTISDINLHGHIHILKTTGNATVEIEGISKDNSEKSDMDLFLSGYTGENAVSESEAGVTISVIVGNKRTIVYSDDPSLNINNSISEALKEIEKYGDLIDEDEKSSASKAVDNVVLSEEEQQDIDEKIKRYRDERYTTEAESNVNEICNMVLSTQKSWTWESTDDKYENRTRLLFVPYTKEEDDGTEFKTCNIYLIKNGEKKPLYVEEIIENEDNSTIHRIDGKFDDVLDVIKTNNFEIKINNQYTVLNKSSEFTI